MNCRLLVRLGVLCCTMALCANVFWTGYVLCKAGPMSDRGIKALLYQYGVTFVCSIGLFVCCLFLFDDLLRRKQQVTDRTSVVRPSTTLGESKSGDVPKQSARSC